MKTLTSLIAIAISLAGCSPADQPARSGQSLSCPTDAVCIEAMAAILARIRGDR